MPQNEDQLSEVKKVVRDAFDEIFALRKKHDEIVRAFVREVEVAKIEEIRNGIRTVLPAQPELETESA